MIQTVSDGRLVGYARVSTDDQHLTLQIDSLVASGVKKDLLFTDKISGAKSGRPGLQKCLAVLRRGDTLFVWRLDRLGRSMSHLVEFIEGLRERGIGFRSVSDGVIDTTSASGELIFHIFSSSSGNSFKSGLGLAWLRHGLVVVQGAVRGSKSVKPKCLQPKSCRSITHFRLAKSAKRWGFLDRLIIATCS